MFELRVVVNGSIESSDTPAVPGGLQFGGEAPSAINYGIRMVGRTSGSDFDLTGYMNSPLGRETYPGREPERDGEYDNDPNWGDLTKVRIGDADEARRKNFYDRIKEQLDRILKAKPWEWGWFKRKAAIYFVVGPFIKKQLGL